MTASALHPGAAAAAEPAGIRYAQQLPDGRRISLLSEAADSLVLRDGAAALARWRMVAGDGGELCLAATEPATAATTALTLLGLFESRPGLSRVAIETGRDGGLAAALVRTGLALPAADPAAPALCPRGMFRQRRSLWLAQAEGEAYPLQYVVTGDRRHPRRPPIPQGEVYRRHCAELATAVSFRTVDPERDLDTFHRWMNDPRVALFWELAGSRQQHADHLYKVLSDPHMHPVLGCFDGEPFGYFEIYWAKEDRIAPYYEVDDYDRGIHMLVGEQHYRGPRRVAAWLPSLAHYLFLDDPRTGNVVAEPRADNAKMIGYLQQTGFYKAKEFDFPHKRAAMMILPREVFFGQYCP